MSAPNQTKLDLRFVSISHPDEIKSRRNGRKIRQHVMKDIGLSRRKKQSNQKIREISDDVTSSASYQQFFELQPHSTSQHGIIPPPVQPLIPNSDSILYSRTDTRAKMMKEFLLRPKSSFCDKVREVCFAVGLANDGAFHLALAEIALYGHEKIEYLHPGREDVNALNHYTFCLQYTSRKIQAMENMMSDGLLITVLCLANYDMNIGNLERYTAHMAGLETIVRSRGGVDKFRSTHLVLSLLWSDVIGCLSLDQPPRFEAPSYLWDQTSPSSISPTLSSIFQDLTYFSPKLASICEVLESLTSVMRASQESRETCSLTIARSAHFLLSIPRGNPPDVVSSPYSIRFVVHETIRLAALKFLVTAAEHTHYTIGAAQYRKPQLSNFIRKQETLWTGLEELQLWILAVAAVTEESCDKAWLTDKMSLLMGKLGLKWSGLDIALRQIAWVDDFDARLGKLEQDVCF
ncbi:hypothetical protein HG530_000833 [Fusarium avenaceum]|nr:hypothetical protein HG530_000833 [Fusarium avenaceum]